MSRLIVVQLLFCALVCRSAIAAKFETPEEVHAAARKYIQSGDADGLAECLTADSLETVAWAYAIGLFGMIDGDAEPALPDGAKQGIETLLVESGLSKQSFDELMLSLPGMAVEKRVYALIDYTKPIRHKPRFIVAAYKLMSASKTADYSHLDPSRACHALDRGIAETAIRGDMAIVKLDRSPDPNVKIDEVVFQRSDAGWLIRFLDLEHARRQTERLKSSGHDILSGAKGVE